MDHFGANKNCDTWTLRPGGYFKSITVGYDYFGLKSLTAESDRDFVFKRGVFAENDS